MNCLVSFESDDVDGDYKDGYDGNYDINYNKQIVTEQLFWIGTLKKDLNSLCDICNSLL